MESSEPDPREGEEFCDRDEDEETILRQRKKSRRVSFADITSVHIFDRDEEFETPPDQNPNGRQGQPVESPAVRNDDVRDNDRESDDSREFFFHGSEDDDLQQPFVRVVESPGSANGSVTSNEEDQFFGPVSDSFIRSGRRSESPMSDDNHDITLDSTAFTLQFHNLMKSDERLGNSGGNLKTPTTHHLTFDFEKTPTEDCPHSSAGSSMVLTEVKKPIPQHIGSDDKSTGNSDSNNMSLIIENPHKYDYARLSPRSIALLEEGYKASKSPSSTSAFYNQSSGVLNPNGSGDEETCKIETGIGSVEWVSDAKTVNLGDGDVGSAPTASDQSSPSLWSPKTRVILPADSVVDFQNEIQNGAIGDIPSVTLSQQILVEFPNSEAGDTVPKNLEIIDATSTAALDQPKMESKHINCSACPAVDSEFPTSGYIYANGKRSSPDTFVSLSNARMSSPLVRGPACSSLAKETIHIVSISSVKNTPTAGLLKSRVLAKEFVIDNPQFDLSGKANSIEVSKPKPVAVPITCVEGHLLGPTLEMCSLGVETPKGAKISEHNEESGDPKDTSMLRIGHISKSTAAKVSPFQFFGMMHKTSELKQNKQMAGIADKFSSPGMELEAKGTPLRILNLKDNLDKHVGSSSMKSSKEGCIRDTTRVMQNLTPRPEGATNSSFLLKENREIVLFNGTDLNEMSNSCRSKDIDNEESYLHSIAKKSEVVGDQQTPLKHRISQSFFSGRRDRSFRTEIDSDKFKGEDLSDGEVKASSYYESASIDVDRGMAFPRQFGTPTHSGKVIFKFVGATKLFSSSVCGLNSRELCILEDMVGGLQKVMKYGKLCTEIRSQDCVGDLQKQRLVETRWLQLTLMYEHAKLQLLHAKRVRLRERVEQLQSMIQECQYLKFNSLQQLCVLDATGAQNEEGHLQYISDESNNTNQVPQRVTTMRQELGVLDQKVKNLIKSIQTSCKMKGSPSFDETVMLATDHVEKKARCRLIHQDLQLWKLGESMSGHNSIVLDYGDLLSRRFSIDRASPFSSMEIFNLLHDANIGKFFPNTDANTAFNFVFNAENDRKLCSPSVIQQETQVTGFLLGNLLDVLEEVLVARLDLPNLILASFCSSCGEQLELVLSFIDCNAGRRVTVVLDMTDLNCAAYPSEIVPSRLEIQSSETQSSKSSFSSEISDAIKRLETGYHRIFRLCKCISQVVQASTK